MSRRFLVGCVLLIASSSSLVWAAGMTVTARINKTRASVGEPLQLTITLDGDSLEGATLTPLQLPADWSALAESQSQEVSWQGGQLHRRLAVTYVVVARAAGEFQLGPFTVERGPDRARAEPLTVHVEQGAAPAPPTLEHPPGGRITL